jgi:CO/xanthine dehydrogenase Mo-binding subunit
MDLKVVGRPSSRVDGPDKVSGNTVYTADVQLPGMLWGKCLRSPYAHARIVSINTEPAKKVKGVRAVLTGEDLPEKRVGLSLQDTPLLATGKVRFIGEKVVAVAAEDRDAAEEALSAIEVEYEELPAVFDARQAMSSAARWFMRNWRHTPVSKRRAKKFPTSLPCRNGPLEISRPASMKRI